MFEFIPARISLCMLVTSGVMVIFVSRISISVAIIDMVKIVSNDDSSTDTTNASLPARLPYCLRRYGSSILVNNSVGAITLEEHAENELQNKSAFSDEVKHLYEAESEEKLLLTTTQRGAILGASFYGLCLASIAGGHLSDKYGTKRIFSIAVLVDACVNLLIPLATKIHYSLLIILRLIIGIFQATCFPALHSLMAVWIPPVERSQFMAFSYISNSISIVITMPVCGIIMSTLGWEAVFYITSALSFTWLIIWTSFMYDRPQDHPRISHEERVMITEAIKSSGTGRKPKSVPWRKMFQSIPLWAISVSHTSNLLGYYILVTQLPIYMSSVIGLSITKNAALSALPFLSRFIGANIAGWIGSFVVKRGFLQIKSSRRLLNVIGLVSPAVAIVLVGYLECKAYMIIAIFALGTFFNGFIIAGYGSNHLDIAPNFAGTCLGISDTIAYLFSMAAPVVIGALTPNESIQEWTRVFWIVFAVYLTGAIFFSCFSSFEVQSWNLGSEVVDDEQRELKTILNTNKDQIKIS